MPKSAYRVMGLSTISNRPCTHVELAEAALVNALCMLKAVTTCSQWCHAPGSLACGLSDQTIQWVLQTRGGHGAM
jgi:hypothetical protein